MTKFRTDTHDAPKPSKAKMEKPGIVPANRLPIFDGHGRMRGRVGRKATAATVSRFGVHGAKLGTKNGRDAWLGQTLAEVSALGSATPGASGDTLADVSSKGATAT